METQARIGRLEKGVVFLTLSSVVAGGALLVMVRRAGARLDGVGRGIQTRAVVIVDEAGAPRMLMEHAKVEGSALVVFDEAMGRRIVLGLPPAGQPRLLLYRAGRGFGDEGSPAVFLAVSKDGEGKVLTLPDR